jgi:HxlR-like helix-turn-helix
VRHPIVNQELPHITLFKDRLSESTESVEANFTATHIFQDRLESVPIESAGPEHFSSLRLVAYGVMEQVPASDGSAYQEYALTQKGRGLLPVLVALRQWGESYLFSRGEKRLQVLDKRTRKPPRLEVKNAKGEILTAHDLELVTVKN